MLRDLVVENLGVIERADLHLEPGSSALTGETGAGKTLLVSALALLLGGRADRSLIREGAREARVEARFELGEGHEALHAARSLGILGEEERELVASRTLAESGGKIRVNGRLVPLATLAQLGPALVEIASQHEHQSLGSRRHQLGLLDAFTGERAVELAERVSVAVRAAAERRGAAQELVAGERERERELDTLRYEIAEIEAAGLTAGTTEHMKAEASRLEHAESIALASEELRALLDGEGAAIASIRQARAVLDKVVDKDRDLGPLVERLDSAIVELDDVIHEVAARVPIVDPELLEGIRQRLASLARLQRKYGGDDETVLDYLERARDKVARLELAALDVERSLREADEQERVALELAAELSSLRQEAAPRLAAEVGALLGELAMGSTRFEVTLVTSELYEGGSETVEMQVAAPGQALRPISKVASGGELSRIALALRLASGAVRGFASTTVFDEVDAGVGGEAARAVGLRLAELARENGTQVLVVTHLPQVAAFADSHYRIEKLVDTESARAVVQLLDEEGRVGEVSRMLAGLPDSERAREHALELLEIAGGR
jgi:DNA repair protein RecN (Recombination protein N)